MAGKARVYRTIPGNPVVQALSEFRIAYNVSNLFFGHFPPSFDLREDLLSLLF